MSVMGPHDEISHAVNICCYDWTFYDIYEVFILGGLKSISSDSCFERSLWLYFRD